MSDKSFQLNKNRFVSVSEFKNQIRVDIREYYFDDNGDRKPGKKGISLSMEEWNKLVSHLPKISKAIKGVDDSSDSDEDKPKSKPKPKSKKSVTDSDSDSNSDSKKRPKKSNKSTDQSDNDSDDKHKSKKKKVVSDSDSVCL